jgi:hypothetical protein
VHLDECLRVVRDERQRARQHPEQDDAERVDVTRRPGRLSRRLFRRDVGGGAEHRPGLGQGAGAGRACEPEVGDLRPSLLVEEDVGGLEIPVNEAARVEVR